MNQTIETQINLNPALFGTGLTLKEVTPAKRLLNERKELLWHKYHEPEAGSESALEIVERKLERLSQWIDACPRPDKSKNPDDPWVTVIRLQRDSIIYQYLLRESVNAGKSGLFQELVYNWEDIPDDEDFEAENVPKYYREDRVRRGLARSGVFAAVRSMWREISKLKQDGMSMRDARARVLGIASETIAKAKTLEDFREQLNAQYSDKL